MKKITLSLSVLILSACAKHGIEEFPTHSVIHYHKGGNIPKVMQEISSKKQPYHVKGFCGSSCTYVLAFPDTCVYPNSRFMFHQAKHKDPELQRAWTKIMFNWYPENLRNFLIENSRPGKNYTFLGKDLNRRNNVKFCPKGK